MSMPVLAESKLERDPYSSTKKLHKWEALFEYLCNILTSGAFLTKICLTLGVRDSIIALIGTTASLACVLSVVAGYLQRYTPIKKWMMPLVTLTRVCKFGIYMLPFMRIGSGVDIFLFALAFFAQASASAVAPAKTNFFLTPVPEYQRTSHIAVVNMLSLIIAIPLQLFGGSFLDYMEGQGKIKEAFLIVAGAILIFSILHVLTLVLSREPVFEKSEHKSIFGDLGSLFQNKKFRFYLLTGVIHNIANGVLAPYLSTYQQKDFGFSLMLSMIFATISNLLSFVGLFFVRLAGRRLSPMTLRILFFVSYLCHDLVWLVMTKETAFAWHFPVVVFSAMIGVAAISDTVHLFSFVGEKERTSALALNGALMGLLTFLTNLLVTPFFDRMQENGVSLFGNPAYPQQILAIVSVALRTIALLLCLFEKRLHKSTK